MHRPWPHYLKDSVFHRGTHTSAKHNFASFLHEDMLDMVQKGYWVILPFHCLGNLMRLKLAPAGVVLQCTRHPQPIMDYTFTEVNQFSVPLAPTEAMQFGHAPPLILQRLAYASPSFGTLLLAKFDLADGYYRMRLAPEQIFVPLLRQPPTSPTCNGPSALRSYGTSFGNTISGTFSP